MQPVSAALVAADVEGTELAAFNEDAFAKGFWNTEAEDFGIPTDLS